MSRRVFFVLAILALIQFTFGTALSPPSQAQARTVDLKAQEEKIRQMVQYVYDRAYALSIYSPLSLYAVNKEVNFVPQKDHYLRLKETSVTDKHWSLRAEKK